MPVSELWVEGDLDAEILIALIAGRPPVRKGGSKTSLRPRVVEERSRGKTAVMYVRDRDYDYDPPPNRAHPVVHARSANTPEGVLGWYWCRHEMENYILEPAIVVSALACDESEYRAALIEAALRIRYYQAARSAVGVTRRSLPPHYEFQTRPQDIPDDKLRLPLDLSLTAVSTWACEQAASHRDRICPQLDPLSVRRMIEERLELLSEARLHQPDEILAWLSGKDLMAALEPWLLKRRIASPGDLRAKLRDWVRQHPAEAISMLPEWRSFITTLGQ